MKYKPVRELEARLQDAALTDTERIEVLQLLAWEHFHHGLPQAGVFIEQALTLLSSHDDYRREQTHHALLTAYQDYSKGDIEAALEKVSQAAAYYQAASIDDWLYRAQTMMFTIYANAGEYVMALETAQTLLDIANKLHDARGAAFAWSAMGIIHLRLGDYQKALDIMQDCNRMAAEQGDTYHQIVIQIHTVAIFLALERYDDALKCAMTALELSASPYNQLLQANIYARLGDIYVQTRQYEAARKAVMQALDLLPSGRWMDTIKFTTVLGKIYRLTGEADRALPFLTKALQQAESMNAKPHIRDCHEELSEVFKQTGDYQQALYHFEQFCASQSRIFNEESVQRLRTLEVIHRTRQAQAEVEQERQLREQERLHFEQLSKIKDDFIAAVSHDLKNPLTSMGLVLYMLERHAGEDDKVQDYVQRLRHNVNSMRYLITDLLDLARLETGYGLEPRPVSVMVFMKEVVQAHEMAAADKHITLQFEPAATDKMMSFDPAQIQRVLDNLISNAIKYTPQSGQIDVNLTQGENEIVVHVKDNGPGISPEHLPHVFERFYRVESRQRGDVEGSGLGLSIVKSIVEKHGGQVWVTSELDKGSEFNFSLPYVHAITL
jgi:signal transduction histidine kinase